MGAWPIHALGPPALCHCQCQYVRRTRGLAVFTLGHPSPAVLAAAGMARDTAPWIHINNVWTIISKMDFDYFRNICTLTGDDITIGDQQYAHVIGYSRLARL